jgi:hypothetical protein
MRGDVTTTEVHGEGLLISSGFIFRAFRQLYQNDFFLSSLDNVTTMMLPIPLDDYCSVCYIQSITFSPGGCTFGVFIKTTRTTTVKLFRIFGSHNLNIPPFIPALPECAWIHQITSHECTDQNWLFDKI